MPNETYADFTRTSEYLDLVKDLRNFPWFSRCGDREPVDSLFSIRWAESASQAQAACTGRFWDIVLLDAQNALSLFLSRSAPHRFQKWNESVKVVKSEVVAPLITSILDERLAASGLGVGARHCVESNLTLALLARAHSDLDGLPRFFEQLLPIYRAGHFPCGWYAGRPPHGVLLVW